MIIEIRISFFFINKKKKEKKNGSGCLVDKCPAARAAEEKAEEKVEEVAEGGGRCYAATFMLALC